VREKEEIARKVATDWKAHGLREMEYVATGEDLTNKVLERDEQ
jgi:hypothetical protein